MTYDYVITKPELNEETLMHFGIKGMKWRKGKLRGKYYSMKSKLSEIRARRMRGMLPVDMMTNGTKIMKPTYGNGSGTKMPNVIGVDTGKANSRSGQAGLRNVSTTKVGKKDRPLARKKKVVAGKGSVKKRKSTSGYKKSVVSNGKTFHFIDWK